MPDFLYLDIETIPTIDPAIIAEIEAAIKPPAAMKKAETIAAWERDKKPDAIKAAVAKSGLNGGTGHICCIAWAWNDNPVQSYSARDINSESGLLSKVSEKLTATRPSHERPTIVGHYVANFDIRFIWQRAFVLGVTLPAWFPRDPKPWSDEVNDTMTMWAGSRDTISLDRLCKALGLDGKSDVTGADVAGMWERGEHDSIAKYCRDDVERVFEIHRKMLISMGHEPAKQGA